MKPSTQFVQNWLILVFIGGFAISAAMTGLAYARGAIYADTLKDIVVRLLVTYAMPLGTIVGGVYGQRDAVGAPSSAQAFWVALIVALLWNLLLVVRIVVFGFAKEDDAAALIAYFNDVSTASVFLVTGTLAFYFARNEPK